MTTTRICIRIDIDTVRDTEVLPTILEMLGKFNMPATFFLTTGDDCTFKNCKNYLNPLKLFQKKAFKQHGIKQMLMGFFNKKQVQSSENLKLIIEKGHELGLHGYLHYEWMNSLNERTEKEIIAWISTGVELFEKETGFKPESFSSPGFTVTNSFLTALDSFNFNYSSDFRGNKEFYPLAGDNQCSTLQLPVAEKSFGELEHEGFSEDEIFERYIAHINKSEDFFIFYMHPSYEPVINKDLLGKILKHISAKENFKVVTMQELADAIKSQEKTKYENTSDI
ncbi:MAG: polysaccharide deacetylase family protein [Methanolobus sp.]